jgi:hypothetical protein
MKKDAVMNKRIGKICHEYGALVVKEEKGRFYWSIEANTFEFWEEISENLFKALNHFQEVSDGHNETR